MSGTTALAEGIGGYDIASFDKLDGMDRFARINGGVTSLAGIAAGGMAGAARLAPASTLGKLGATKIPGVGSLRRGAPKGVTRPAVNDPKLKNIVDDLYKGDKTPNPIGTGSTADAIRHEMRTGQQVGGRWHTQKGQDYSRALQKWLKNNPNAPAAERTAAQQVLDDLSAALGGN